jgi:EAL domain-containing protein (putative c-di-GMP-specific phosphodiesterase class I)
MTAHSSRGLRNTSESEIIQLILGLAKTLRLDVVAEGCGDRSASAYSRRSAVDSVRVLLR